MISNNNSYNIPAPRVGSAWRLKSSTPSPQRMIRYRLPPTEPVNQVCGTSSPFLHCILWANLLWHTISSQSCHRALSPRCPYRLPSKRLRIWPRYCSRWWPRTGFKSTPYCSAVLCSANCGSSLSLGSSACSVAPACPQFWSHAAPHTSSMFSEWR